MKKIKKRITIISISLLAVIIIAPIIIFSSILDNKNDKKSSITHSRISTPYLDDWKKLKLKHNKFPSFDFKDISKNEPKLLGGLQFTAYSQGFSFIINMIKHMGWNWEDEAKIKKLHDPNFDWETLDVTKSQKSESQFDKNHTKITPFEKSLIQKMAYYDKKADVDYVFTIGSLMIKDKIQPQTHLWNLINNLVWADPNEAAKDNLKNIDASTEVVINLNKNFENLDNSAKFKHILNLLNENSNKIFPNLKYAYNWSGSELTQLAFQISNGKLLVWHYSHGQYEKSLHEIQKELENIYKFDKGIQEKLYDYQDFDGSKVKENKSPYSSSNKAKNLSQVWIDPLGSEGTMSHVPLFTGTTSKIDPSQKNMPFSSFNNHKTKLYFNKVPFLYNYNHGSWMFDLENKDNLIEFVSFSSFINASKPGEVILKVFAGENNWATNKIYYPVRTFKSPNLMQTFYKIENQDKKQQFYSMFSTFFNNLRWNMWKKGELINKFIAKLPPTISSLLHFVKYKNFSTQEIQKAFDYVNNGSHYMLGVEMFLRGIKNMPKYQTDIKVPLAIKMYIRIPGIVDNSIQGMANTNNFINLLNYMYNIEHMNLVGNFDPITKKIKVHPFSREKRMKYFLEDLSKERRTGIEFPPFQPKPKTLQTKIYKN